MPQSAARVSQISMILRMGQRRALSSLASVVVSRSTSAYPSLVEGSEAPSSLQRSRQKVAGNDSNVGRGVAIVAQMEDFFREAETSHMGTMEAADARGVAMLEAAVRGPSTADYSSAGHMFATPLPHRSITAAENVLSLWTHVQSRGFSGHVRAGAASVALRTYTLIGAHRLNVALFNALHQQGIRPSSPALLAVVQSARLIGDPDAVSFAVSELTRIAASTSVSRVELAQRYEAQLEACIRAGDAAAGRVGPILTAIAALNWPLPANFFRLAAMTALEANSVETASAALRELVCLRRDVFSATSIDVEAENLLAENPQNARQVLKAFATKDARLAAKIVATAADHGHATASALAYHALRDLSAAEDGLHVQDDRTEATAAAGPARHVRLLPLLAVAASRGLIVLAEAVAADTLSHASLIEEAAIAFCTANAIPSDEVNNNASDFANVFVLQALIDASIRCDDVGGALRASALVELISNAARARGSKFAPVLALSPAIRESLARMTRITIVRFDTWERRVRSGDDVSSRHDTRSHTATSGMTDDNQGNYIADFDIGVSAANSNNLGVSSWGSEESPHESVASGTAEAAPMAPSHYHHAPIPQSKNLAPSLRPYFVAAASLTGMPADSFLQSQTVPTNPFDAVPSRADLLSALGAGYSAVSYAGRIVALSSIEADALYSSPDSWVGFYAACSADTTRRLFSSSGRDLSAQIAEALEAATFTPLSVSAVLAALHGGSAKPLSEGNYGVFETLKQTLATGLPGGSPGGSSGIRARSGPRSGVALTPMSPALLSVCLMSLSTSKHRAIVPHILTFAMRTLGISTPEADAFAATLEAVISAHHMSHANASRLLASGSSSSAANETSAGIEKQSAAEWVRRMRAAGVAPNGAFASSLSHFYLRMGCSISAGAILRGALSDGVMPNAVAFNRLLREAVISHEAGKAALRTSAAESALLASRPPDLDVFDAIPQHISVEGALQLVKAAG